MAEVVEPDPGAPEDPAALDLETPVWKAPEDVGPQVGVAGSRSGRGDDGPPSAGVAGGTRVQSKVIS